MAKHIDALDGFTVSDLISENGITFEIGDDCLQEDDDEIGYSADVNLTNEEVLNMLNMEEFLDEEEEVDESTAVMPYSISFDKLKPKMTDLTGDQKVMKLIKRQGVGEVIPFNAQVTVKYIGYFEYMDEPFDSTFAHGTPARIRLDRGEIIVGLEIGISSMRKHEIAIFIVHPDLAYGQFGCPPRIPGNSEVMFAVHLIDYIDNGSADTYENLSVEERKLFPNIVTRVNHQLNTAKDNFKRKKIRQAIRDYRKAITWLENASLKNDEEENEMNILLSKAYTNLAVCYNKETMPRYACAACNKVPIKSAKTHFNHGRALLVMGEYTRAIQELQTALKMEPNNTDVIKEIQLANVKHKRYLEMEKSLWSNCLNTQKENKEMPKFQKAARDMCENFVNDSSLLRLPLPECLTAEEDKYIREQAAAFGVCVTTHVRYGKEITYLCKKNY